MNSNCRTTKVEVDHILCMLTKQNSMLFHGWYVFIIYKVNQKRKGPTMIKINGTKLQLWPFSRTRNIVNWGEARDKHDTSTNAFSFGEEYGNTYLSISQRSEYNFNVIYLFKYSELCTIYLLNVQLSRQRSWPEWTATKERFMKLSSDWWFGPWGPRQLKHCLRGKQLFSWVVPMVKLLS